MIRIKRNGVSEKQNVLMFVMHLTAFLVMYLEKKDNQDFGVISDAGNASWRKPSCYIVLFIQKYRVWL